MVSTEVYKEQYMSAETIASDCQNLLDDIESHLFERPYNFDLTQSALLILDMQDFFLAESSHAHVPSAQAIIPNLRALIKCFASAARPVVFTRHLNNDTDAGMMRTFWRDLLKRDNPLSAITDQLDTSSGLILEKSQYDAFLNSDLQQILSEQNVRQLVIGGVMTHLCCESTARGAFMRNFEPFMLLDGSATYNRKFHQSSLINLSHGFAHIVSSSEIIQKSRGSL
ncbi:MAG: isochorismatase family protein [candidate division Zixibacteria bacterium]